MDHPKIILDTNCLLQILGAKSRWRKQVDVMNLHTTPAIQIKHDDNDNSERNRKIFAAIATAIVFLILINTIGLFGVAALGLLAGGLIKS